MSRYAWFVCTDCEVMLWLGKAAMKGECLEYIYPLGGTRQAAQKPTLNCAIWKMLADHAGHILRVVTDQDPEYVAMGTYTEIGGDEDHDIDFETYLKDWSGRKTCGG